MKFETLLVKVLGLLMLTYYVFDAYRNYNDAN
jgi:hypothetical protein